MAWGGFVTSIDAGMAFPDWPTSLGSYNFLNPVDGWYEITPYLAEHGHRLIASAVGLLTVILAVWTWMTDPRRWMRWLAVAAVALVIFQGVLGGLRVLFVSLDLAAVHACVAQIFFATIVALTVFTSRSWLEREALLEPSPQANRFVRWSAFATTAVYVQIVLGALLRHQGAGIHPWYVGFHVTGAFIASAAVIWVFALAFKHLWAERLYRRAATGMALTLLAQFALGLTALLVIMSETYAGIRSPLQILLNSTHLIVGALLFASLVRMTLLTYRRHPVSASTSA